MQRILSTKNLANRWKWLKFCEGRLKTHSRYRVERALHEGFSLGCELSSISNLLGKSFNRQLLSVCYLLYNILSPEIQNQATEMAPVFRECIVYQRRQLWIMDNSNNSLINEAWQLHGVYRIPWDTDICWVSPTYILFNYNFFLEIITWWHHLPSPLLSHPILSYVPCSLSNSHPVFFQLLYVSLCVPK